MSGLPEHGRDFAGHAQVAERVGTVGVGLDVQDDVAVLLLRLLGDEADHGQPVERAPEGDVDVDVVLEPVQTDLHLRWNCLLKRRSFS